MVNRKNIRRVGVAALFAASLSICSATVITVPGTAAGNNSASPIPLTLETFGVLPSGLTEVISASLFTGITGPIHINSIALRADPTNTSTGPQTADLLLTANGTTVYNGSFSFSTANTGLFDMVVNFSSPYTYDPTGGDLNLGVTLANVVTGAGGDILPDAWVFLGGPVDNGISTLIPDLLPTPLVGSGLVLQINFDAAGPAGVPEPATFAMIGTGLIGAVLLARRRRQTE